MRCLTFELKINEPHFVYLPENTTGTNFSVVAGRSYKHTMTHDFCLWLANVSIQSPLLGESSHDL